MPLSVRITDSLQDIRASLLETMCSLISKLTHSNIIHQVFLVLTAVPVCLGAGVTVFLSGVGGGSAGKDNPLIILFETYKEINDYLVTNNILNFIEDFLLNILIYGQRIKCQREQ